MNEHIVHMRAGRLVEDDSPASHVRALVRRAVDEAGAGGIVLHMHGGLVSEHRARGIVEHLTPEYRQADAYPVFFVWESGLLETLRNNLLQAAQESLFVTVFKRVWRTVKRKAQQGSDERSAGTLPVLDTLDEEAALAAALLAGAPLPDALLALDAASLSPLSVAERAALGAELANDGELIQAVQRISAGLREPLDIEADAATRSAAPVVAAEDSLLDPAAADRLVDRPDRNTRGLLSTAKVAKAVVMVAYRVINRFVNQRDHGLHATLVEEILRELYLANVGGRIWSMMKQDTADSFGPDATRFGGTAVLSELASVSRQAPIPRVTLVGHSTGAVYIAHLLQAADALMPAGFQFDVVFLAPASTSALTAQSFARYSHRIRDFRMFSMSDENELSDTLVPVLYPHSLLYFVSGVVEGQADEPIVGMARYLDAERYPAGEFPDVDYMRRYLWRDGRQTVWSVANDGPGRASGALKHGDFDNDEVTLASIQQILRDGF